MSADLLSQQFPITTYSTGDGLPQASVGKVFQDSKGFLWIGTHGGASRYDGMKFRSFLVRGSERSVINDIWESPDHTLWFATHGNGIARLQEGDTTFTWMKAKDGVLPDDYVETIVPDNQRNLWIGTNGGVVVLKTDGTVTHYDTSSGLPHNRVRAISRTADAEMLLGTSGGLISARVALDGGLRTELILPFAVRSLLVRRNGGIAVGTRSNGVFIVKSGNASNLLPRGKCESLCEDSSGVLWAGMSDGLYFWEGKRSRRIGPENGLESVLIGEVAVDREGILWVGSGDGLMKLSPFRFENFSRIPGLESPIILSMCKDRSGSVWLGTYDGLFRLSSGGAFAKFTEAHGLANDVVYDLAEHGNGTIWAATPSGVSIITRHNVQSPQINGLRPGEPVGAVLVAGDTIWVGCKGKVIMIDGDQTTLVLNHEIGLPNDLVRTLYVDSRGALWLGTSGNGLGHYKEGSLKMFGRKEGLPNPWVESIIEDEKGRIWATTHGGIVAIADGNVIGIPPSENVLERGVVFCVEQDRHGRLWFGTEQGVYLWRDSVVQHISVQDGLAADIVHAIVIDSEDAIWFGTHDGVTRGVMDYIVSSVPVPAVYVTSVTSDVLSGKPQGVGEFRYSDRTLVFGFNALSFVDERNIRFQWMVKGFDPEWQAPQQQRYVRYTNLEPGTYTFAVRAANRGGAWSAPTEVAFTILPPFWRTWWFIALALTVTVSVVLLLYRYRVNQLLKIERVRTRIATDLHDDIGASLSRIALFSEAAKEEATRVSPKLFEMAEKIGNDARELLDAIGTLVWSIDPRHDRFEDVVTYMKNFAQEILSIKGVDYSFTMGPGVGQLRLPLESRKNLLLIFKEAINNCVRHSGCKSAQISLFVAQDMLEMSISDDGKGLQSETTEHGHGLVNMRMRAKSIGGQCAIVNNSGRGLRVQVRIPLR
jgi:ligand-binding sensor domain-containing protein